MPEHRRHRERDLALQHVQVGVADTAGGDPHEDLAAPRPRHGNPLDRERPPELGQDGRQHRLREGYAATPALTKSPTASTASRDSSNTRCPSARQDPRLGVRERGGPDRRLLDRDQAVGVAPDDERRHRQAVQPLGELRVVGPLPGDPRERRRLAIARRPGTRASAASRSPAKIDRSAVSIGTTSSSGMLKKSTVGCSRTQSPNGAASTSRRTRCGCRMASCDAR